MNRQKILRSCAIHDGGYHADEVTACALLIVFGQIDQESIYRTRDEAVLAQCEFVCDVGGVYDESIKNFDHHQSSYTGPLSSAGMILLYLFRQKIVEEGLYHYLKENLVDGVDLIDNGSYTPRVGIATFSQVIANFLPVEYETSIEEMNLSFKNALAFTVDYLKKLHGRYLYVKSCMSLVEAEMQKNNKLLVFDELIPWQDAFFALGGETHPALFVIMPTSDRRWKLRGIPPSIEEKMAVRAPLPIEWAGLANGDLKKISGIEGAVFCHKGRFVSFWKTREDALRAYKEICNE